MQSLPSAHRAIINTSVSRGRLRVSVCGRIINPISPVCVAMLTPGDTGPVSLNDPGLHPRNYRAPGPGSTLTSAIGVTQGTIIGSTLSIHAKIRIKYLPSRRKSS